MAMIDDLASLPTGLIMATSEACLYDPDGRMIASFARVDEAHAVAALMTNAPALLAVITAAQALLAADDAGKHAARGDGDLMAALTAHEAAEAALRVALKEVG
jgi:hypothetical protein